MPAVSRIRPNDYIDYFWDIKHCQNVATEKMVSNVSLSSSKHNENRLLASSDRVPESSDPLTLRDGHPQPAEDREEGSYGEQTTASLSLPEIASARLSNKPIGARSHR
jgi:hypothetical protein